MDRHDLLGLSAETFDDLSEHFVRREHDAFTYRHLPDYRSRVDRGTVLIDDDIPESPVVPGFPKIPRTLVLDPGVENHFDGEIVVEEKLNGYNVRIARIDGEVFAFTRSGLVCPYTTYLARERFDVVPLLDARPELTVCGETIGPENPYTTHDYTDVDGVAFRLFDLRERPSGDPLPVDERRALCTEYGLPHPRLLGRHDAADAARPVREAIERLDEEDGEGVVMKSVDGRDQLKYTTSVSTRSDLEYAFSLFFDYGREFTFRRVIREGFQAAEWGVDEAERDERAHAIGEAILSPMIETIEAVERGEPIGDRHTVRGPPEVIDDLLDHFREMGMHLTVEDDRRTEGERIVTFIKVHQSTRDKTAAYLDGTIVRE